tara:strand:- start:28165 stop:28485 length:321 start_codon:yes stop_codon:yes gene_type:complete
MWENILKRSQSKFSSNNLPMLKDMIDRMLDDIPKGTKFTIEYVIDNFGDYAPDSKPDSFLRWWGNENFRMERRGVKWIKSYFSKYARNRNLIGVTMKSGYPTYEKL